MILCCLAAFGFAQEHLTFKGIPITGSMETFCQRLCDKGFKQTDEYMHTVCFTGNFIGFYASVRAVSTDDYEGVLGVVVKFGNSNTWNDLVDTYDYCKKLYVEKYGEPKRCVEENPSHKNTAHYGRVTYRSLFEAKGGQIIVAIERGPKGGTGHICIEYYDDRNAQAEHQRYLDDI